MKLYILRHGIAVDRGMAGYEDDSRRPLTTEGRKQMLVNAKGMKALGLSFDLILSSPYARALQTAEVVTRVFKKNKIALTDNLIPDAPFQKLITEINAAHKKAGQILLVGHEPHLSGFIGFCSIGKDMPMEFKKGGLCLLSADGLLKRNASALEWLLTPAQLRSFIHRPQGCR